MIEKTKVEIIEEANDEMELSDFLSLEANQKGEITYLAFQVEKSKYVVYDGNILKVTKEYHPSYVQVGNVLADKMQGIFTEPSLIKIKDYLLRPTGTHLLDSGGANFAPILTAYFTKQGIDVTNVTYQMYYNPNTKEYKLNIADSNINDGLKKEGDTVKYVQYIYSDGSLQTIDRMEYEKNAKVVKQYDSSSGKSFYILECK